MNIFYNNTTLFNLDTHIYRIVSRENCFFFFLVPTCSVHFFFRLHYYPLGGAYGYWRNYYSERATGCFRDISKSENNYKEIIINGCTIYTGCICCNASFELIRASLFCDSQNAIFLFSPVFDDNTIKCLYIYYLISYLSTYTVYFFLNKSFRLSSSSRLY